MTTPKSHHPVKFSDVVTAALAAAHTDSDRHENGMPRSPPVRTPVCGERPVLHISPSTAVRASRHVSPVLDTPSSRTGPPRSLSYYFTPSSSPIGPHFTSLNTPGLHEDEQLFANDLAEHSQLASKQLRPRRQSTFRGALELVSPSDLIDRKGKARDTSMQEESGTSPRWLESPIDEKPTVTFEDHGGTGQSIEHVTRPSRHDTAGWVKHDESLSKEQTDSQRSYTLPPPRSSKHSHSGVSDKWAKLRALIPSVVRQSPSAAITHAVTPPEVNIIDELITGGLSNLMLGLWFERDDKSHRRVPVLLHRLRIRISDSLHPSHAHKAVFRIECEYANGAARWVIYRQLRDFISLHTHYAISNAFSSHKDKLPEFPRTSTCLHLHLVVSLTALLQLFRTLTSSNWGAGEASMLISHYHNVKPLKNTSSSLFAPWYVATIVETLIVK